MARYTKKDADGRYYIESVNGKLESDKFGHTYGEAIDRFAELENADVAPRAEVEELREAYNYRLAKDIQTNADFVRYATAEVAREIFEEIDREICLALESNYKARGCRQMIIFAHGSSTLDREFIEYVNGKIDALRGIEAFVEELKNKYAEEQTDGN